MPFHWRPRTATIAALSTVLSFAAQASIEQWHPTDLSFTSTTSFANPFSNVTVSATFTGPGNTTLTIPGFHDGNATWIVRFSPTKIGDWTYTTSSGDAQLNGKTGTVTCLANTQANVHGKLAVDPSNVHHFIYEDGTPYFLLGWENDWLALMDFGDTNVTKAKRVIDIYAARHFTHVILNVYAYDTDWKPGTSDTCDFGPPTGFAWAGTYANADQSRMNTAFFDHFDRVIDYLFQKGIVAHIFFKVYNKHVNWPARSSRNDSLYFSYVTSRYEAYPNIIWDYSKESYNEPDHAYIQRMLELVKSKDAYHRLAATHDDDDYCSDPAYDSSIDFYTDQQHGSYYSTIISQRNARNWPILNAEYEYEWGPNGANDYTYQSVQSPESVLKATYEILMAGGYPGYYYTYHAWDVVRYYEEPKGLKYYGYLAGLFNMTKWYSLVPSDNLIGNSGGNHCLAKAGSEYVVYFVNGGSANLTIAGASGQLNGTWMNAYTGETQNAGPFNNGATALTAPWSNAPSVVWLHTGGQTPPRRPVVRGTVRAKAVSGTTYAVYSINGRLMHGFTLVNGRPVSPDGDTFRGVCIVKDHGRPGTGTARIVAKR